MDQSKEILVSVLIGTFLTSLLTVTVIYFVTLHRKKFLAHQNKLQRIALEQQQELLKAMISTQERERGRIARNLHDEIGVHLSLHRFAISKHAAQFRKQGVDIQELVNELNALDETIHNMSRACHELYPTSLQATGFLQSVNAIFQKLGNSSNIKCNGDIRIREDQLLLSPDDKLSLLRVCQEALNNIVKYSNCQKIDLVIKAEDGQLVLMYSHNGHPFTNSDVEVAISKSKGLGLVSIRDRLKLLQGKIDYFSENDLTHVMITASNTNVPNDPDSHS